MLSAHLIAIAEASASAGTPASRAMALLEQADPATLQWLNMAVLLVLAAGVLLDVLLGVAAIKGRLGRGTFPEFPDEAAAERGTLGLVGTLLAASGLILLLTPRLPSPPALDTEIWALMLQSFAFHGNVLLVLGLGARALGLPARVLWGEGTSGIAQRTLQGCIFFVAIMPPIYAASALGRCLLRLFEAPTDLQDVLLTITSRQPWSVRIYLFALAVLLAPLAEELLFRGVLLRVFRRRIGTAGAVLASSALFAAVHLHLPALAPIFVLSLGLSVAYLRTGSLVIPIVMHALFNGFSLVIMLGLQG